MLNTELNLAAPDDVYEALVALHRDLTPAQSRLVNARLILLLANHIGDAEVLRQAMARARAGIEPEGRDDTPQVVA
ncbi:DUF2783 domain-containing protein [Roseicella sp. DB1501]|jgi:hypothetical protein|uniref:DUF2783 domain-containing protein n=1 Tax=Roseicella sp. DB1501 TaxID=2730925 RepID=UPI0014918416|nr:DUF2783 domain-containing protein [Roseicella sp. DB1501]NOG72197.1 DUF2783 domain-containing protein [Roseicella sp. DB1501]